MAELTVGDGLWNAANILLRQVSVCYETPTLPIAATARSHSARDTSTCVTMRTRIPPTPDSSTHEPWPSRQSP